jgi:hypothetical protein
MDGVPPVVEAPKGWRDELVESLRGRQAGSGCRQPHGQGAGAEHEAAKRADLMLDRGDDEERHLWQRIRQAVEKLQAQPCGKPN